MSTIAGTRVSEGGTYEAHVTVAVRDDETGRRFAAACERLAVKRIHIELARGEARFQPMTASHHRGTLAEVRREVDGLARAVGGEGFEVTRVKIEALGDNQDIPLTDAEARARSAGYSSPGPSGWTTARGTTCSRAVRRRCSAGRYTASTIADRGGGGRRISSTSGSWPATRRSIPRSCPSPSRPPSRAGARRSR